MVGRCRTTFFLNEQCCDETEKVDLFSSQPLNEQDSFANVCRRESNCVETDSICQNNRCTTTVATQTDSLAAVQIIHSSDESTLFGDSYGSERPSLYQSGFCQYHEGFYERNRVCKAEDGSSHDSRCVSDSFYLPNMRACIKCASSIHSQPRRYTYGAAFCPTMLSRPPCRCHEQTYYNENIELVEMNKGLGNFCVEDSKIVNTFCTDQSTCECKSNSAPQDSEGGESPPVEVEFVDETSPAILKHLGRRNDDFVGINSTCLEKARKYDDTCEETDQCAPLLGDENSGKKELGQCSKTGEGDDDHETADGDRSGVCQCKFDHSANNSQNQSVRPKEKNSSKGTNQLKIITLTLIFSAVVITFSALKDAYYP